MTKRYELDDADDADTFSADGGPDFPADPAPADAGEPSPEEYKQYAMHCAMHPHAAKIAAYAMQDEPAEPPADQTTPPDAPADTYGAFPSSTNADLPGAKAKPFSRQGAKPRTVAENAVAIRHSRLEAEVAELKRENAEAKARAAQADAERRVTQLVGEGYDVDAERMVKRYSRMTDAQRDEEDAYVREIARKDPAARMGRVPLAETPRTPAGGVPGDISEDHMARALRYQRDKGVHYSRWAECVEATKNK